MKKLIILAFAAAIFVSCSSRDDDPAGSGGQAYSGMPLVILDTDIGSSTDDLFALEILYNYEQQGRCRLLGVVVDREGEDCAACADVMNTYFGQGSVPVGLVRDGIKNPKVWIDYKALPTYTNGDSTLMFARSIGDVSWTDRHPIKQVYILFGDKAYLIDGTEVR